MTREDLKYILETLEYGLKSCSDDDNDTTTHFNRFQNSIDVVERELNKNDIIPDVVQRSEPLNCTFELGVENCGFKAKDVFTCKHIRKCDMCAN